MRVALRITNGIAITVLVAIAAFFSYPAIQPYLPLSVAAYLHERWIETAAFSNSSAFTAIMGSLAGAWGGAQAAQRIAEKSKRKDDLLKEIRNTNAAISVAFGVCNSLLGLKKQFAKPLKDEYDQQRQDLKEFHERRAAGQDPNIPFAFDGNFKTITPLILPIELLQRQLFEKLSVGSRALSLATTLEQTAHDLTVTILQRNRWIETYKEGTQTRQLDLPWLYFGFANDSGFVDENYKNLVQGIYSQTDDAIFFSHLLCKDLVAEGRKPVDAFTSLFGKGATTIATPDFKKAEKAGLMPDEANYVDWLTGFVKAEDLNKATG